MSEDLLYFNGLNGSSGTYLTGNLTLQDLANVAKGEPIENREADAHFQELRAKHETTLAGGHLGPAAGVDPNDLSSAGWAVIFANDIDPAVKEALKPLLDHRRELATKQKEHYYLEGVSGPTDTIGSFQKRYKFGPGPADPEKMPYYVLLVGNPQQIPYRLQYQLDVQYAVGRIHFDTPAEYARYAQSVIEVETGKAAQLPRRATFFGVRNPDDRSTNLSADQLVKPLTEKLREKQESSNWKGRGRPQWDMPLILGDDATKARLSRLIGGDETPALLFTASHGVGFDLGDPRQLPHQGALVCQDWPGPLEWRTAIPQDHYFASDDISDDARLLGMMAFFFACYGAGTPQMDEFNHRAFKAPKPIAPHDFIARLPQRMLSHPKGGALAVVGHVERAWGYSFMWEGVGATFTAFESALEDLLRKGYPVGAAVEYINERYAELAVNLNTELEEIKFFNKKENDLLLAGMWTASNDSRSYVIIGDPAVRLPVGAEAGPTAERPTISEITLARSNGAAAPSTATVPVTTTEAAPSIAMGPVTTTEAAPIAPAASPTATAVVATATVTPEAANVEFGLFSSDGGLKQAQTNLLNSLQQFAEKLGASLQKTLDNVTSLEVRTYISDDLAQVEYSNGKFSGDAKLIALTRIGLDQDTVNLVPRRDGEIDESLWAIHADTVRLAQAQRAEMIKAMASAVSGLLGMLKG